MTQGPGGLVLASSSPRRRALLERMGWSFEVCPADVEEDDSGRLGGAAMVAANAALKADAVAAGRAKKLVLGSDTTVALGAEVLAKPENLEEARRMLRRLSGRMHTVYTAVALRWVEGGFSKDFVETSEVLFRRFDEATITAYFEQVDPLDKAGAYGIQEGKELIVERVDGSVENVMGLPVQTLEACFGEHGFVFPAKQEI